MWRLTLFGAGAGLSLLLLGMGLWPRLANQSPAGLRVLGAPLPRNVALETHLGSLRSVWQQQQVALRVGSTGFSTSRANLGADLPIDLMSRTIQRYGRAGNPLVTMAESIRATVGQVDVAWPPTVNAETLQTALSAVRRNVEHPPMVGTRDDDGHVIDGQDGVTLNLIEEVSTLSRGLRSGQTDFHLRLITVPAPEPLAIGAADGAVYSEHVPPPPPGEDATLPAALLAAQQAARPEAWLPDQGRECIEDGEYQGFCQGPRRVAEPYGQAAQRSEALRLGGPAAVAAALNGHLPDAWLEAAPTPAQEALLRPVPAGRLWRGFGIVTHQDGRRRLHKGIDVGAAAGTPIRAVQSGLVVYSDNAVRGYGNLLVVIHHDGSAAFYAHCQAIYVFPGQSVTQGAIVAEVGDTGFARGKHLHFEYHRDGAPGDPQPLFEPL